MMETNLAEIRKMTIAVATIFKVENPMFGGIVIHPFVSTNIWGEKMMETKDMNELDLTKEEVYQKWLMNYHHRQYRKWFLQYQSSIVRHVHSATTPLGKTLRHTLNVV